MSHQSVILSRMASSDGLSSHATNFSPILKMTCLLNLFDARCLAAYQANKAIGLLASIIPIVDGRCACSRQYALSSVEYRFVHSRPANSVSVRFISRCSAHGMGQKFKWTTCTFQCLSPSFIDSLMLTFCRIVFRSQYT